MLTFTFDVFVCSQPAITRPLFWELSVDFFVIASSFFYIYSFALNTSFCFRSLAALKSCYMQTAYKSILMFSFQLKSHILDQDLYKFLSWRLFFCLLLTTSFHLRKKRRRTKIIVFCLFTIWLSILCWHIDILCWSIANTMMNQ